VIERENNEKTYDLPGKRKKEFHHSTRNLYPVVHQITEHKNAASQLLGIMHNLKMEKKRKKRENILI
jgi:hypothetical protein